MICPGALITWRLRCSRVRQGPRRMGPVRDASVAVIGDFADVEQDLHVLIVLWALDRIDGSCCREGLRT